jgi:hypothetical protein
VKQGENIVIEQRGRSCRLRCTDCNEVVTVSLPAQGREHIEFVNGFARTHRHWNTRWSLGRRKQQTRKG